MNILPALLNQITDGQVLDVRLGLHWTAVVVEVKGRRQCGLSASIFPGHLHKSEPDVPLAGGLDRLSGLDLAEFVLQNEPILASIGLAALNALLPRPEYSSPGANAEDLIAAYGAGKNVVLVGHFPFVPRLRSRVGKLVVLEQNPGSDDMPADAAPNVLPSAQVVAITAMTLINHTLESLVSLCPSAEMVMLIGPSTPLTPRLFDFGIDILSGVDLTEIDPVLRVVSQGGNFRQVHKAGARLVNLSRIGMKKI